MGEVLAELDQESGWRHRASASNHFRRAELAATPRFPKATPPTALDIRQPISLALLQRSRCVNSEEQHVFDIADRVNENDEEFAKWTEYYKAN